MSSPPSGSLEMWSDTLGVQLLMLRVGNLQCEALQGLPLPCQTRCLHYDSALCILGHWVSRPKKNNDSVLASTTDSVCPHEFHDVADISACLCCDCGCRCWCADFSLSFFPQYTLFYADQTKQSWWPELPDALTIAIVIDLIDLIIQAELAR